MKIHKLLTAIVLSFSLVLTFSDLFSQSTAVMEQTDTDALARIEQLPHQGVLQDNGKGYIYLKVDDSYIKDVFPLLRAEGYKEPAYFRRPDSPGAHISVFYEEETRGLTKKITEIGQDFSFVPDRIETVRNGRNRYIILKVTSPDLEALRKKYGLRPLLQGHDFHVTLAVQRVR